MGFSKKNFDRELRGDKQLKKLLNERRKLKQELFKRKLTEKVNMKTLVSVTGVSTIALIGVLYGLGGLNSMDPGEVGLKTKQFGDNRGMQKETLGNGEGGTYWVDPIMYDVVVYNMRCRQYPMEDMRVETGDGQPVEVDVSFEICLDATKIPDLHRTVGPTWYDSIVFPRAREAIREATSAQKSSKIYKSEGRKAVRDQIQETIAPGLAKQGIILDTNLRNLKFLNPAYVQTLEQKSIAAEKEEINARLAKAAIEEANRLENEADGKKREAIKIAEAKKAQAILAAEAEMERLKLEGEGLKLKKEAEADGILAVAKAEAEGTRLQVQAYGGGQYYASVQWAQNLGPNVKVWGVPTGAEGTNSFMDLNGMFHGAITGHSLSK